MKKMNYKKLLIPLVVLSCVVVANSSYGLNVDSSECPGGWSEYNCTPCQTYPQCTRSDAPASITSSGSLSDVAGEQFKCENCAGCPNEPGPVEKCEGTVKVSYNESHNYSINPGIKVSGEVIEASLTGVIGWGHQTSYEFSLTCGSASWPVCKKADPAYGITMQAWSGVAAQVISSYTWVVGHSGCCTGTSTYGAGTRVSTASGSKVKQGSATCKSIAAPSDC